MFTSRFTLNSISRLTLFQINCQNSEKETSGFSSRELATREPPFTNIFAKFSFLFNSLKTRQVYFIIESDVLISCRSQLCVGHAIFSELRLTFLYFYQQSQRQKFLRSFSSQKHFPRNQSKTKFFIITARIFSCIIMMAMFYLLTRKRLNNNYAPLIINLERMQK